MKTTVQKWHRWKCPLVFEYKSRVVLKQSLQKRLLTNQCDLKEEKTNRFERGKKRISHFISLPAQWASSSLTSLFVLDPHLYILVHLFLPRAFTWRMSWITGFFHWVPSLNNFCLLDKSLNILASSSGGEVKNCHAYQNVSLEWTQNNKQSMFSCTEVINFYDAGGQ